MKKELIYFATGELMSINSYTAGVVLSGEWIATQVSAEKLHKAGITTPGQKIEWSQYLITDENGSQSIEDEFELAKEQQQK